MANLIGRTVPRIGSLARRCAKQPAAADWLHNTADFTFRSRIVYSSLPATPDIHFFFLLHGLSTISSSQLIMWWSNFVVNVDTSLGPLRCSEATLIEIPSREVVIFQAGGLSAMPVGGRAVDEQKERYEKFHGGEIRLEYIRHSPPIIPIMFTTNLKIRS